MLIKQKNRDTQLERQMRERRKERDKAREIVTDRERVGNCQTAN